MIKPMLAVPMSKGNVTDWNLWAIEKKFDGHRLIVEVRTPRDGPTYPAEVFAWSRPRKRAGNGNDKTMAARTLPPHLVHQLGVLPDGVYDGELLAVLPDGTEGTATDVTRLDLQDSLRFIVFDVLRVGAANHQCMSDPYEQRRVILTRIFNGREVMGLLNVALAESKNVTCQDDVDRVLKAIWAAGGEGVILKRKAATYQAGKRSTDFIKMKRLEHGVGTVAGFEPTRGKVLDRGLFAVVKLRTDDGYDLTLKTCDDEQIAAFEREWEQYVVKHRMAREALTTLSMINAHHPALGRRLMFEFPFRTRTGNYQGPIIWDRWENE